MKDRKEWDSAVPIRYVFSDLPFSETGVETIVGEYRRFRAIDEPSSVVELCSSDELFGLLFGKEATPTSATADDTDFVMLDLQDETRKRINIDPVAEDFVQTVFLRQRVVDLAKKNGLSEATVRFLAEPYKGTVAPNIKGNTLIRIETLFDVLRLSGVNMEPQSVPDVFTLFTNPPERMLTTTEIADAIDWVVYTARLSKYVRRLSVLFQDKHSFPDVLQITPERFGLPDKMKPLSNKRTILSTQDFATDITLNRELRLWDPFRNRSFQDIRRISQYTLTPYRRLLQIQLSYNGRPHKTDQFDGLDFLTTIPPNVRRVLKRSIDDRLNHN